MEPTLPRIEELNIQLSELSSGDVLIEEVPFFDLQRIQVQAFLHICQELEAINNNLEALRPPHISGINLRATLDAHGEEITLLKRKLANLPKGYSI